MLQDSAQTWPPGPLLSGRLSTGTMTAQTERAFTEYWHNDGGIKKKKKKAKNLCPELSRHPPV